MDLCHLMRTTQENLNEVSLIEKQLIGHGLKTTPLRRLILGVLVKETTHLTVAQICLLVSNNKHKIALASVYRNINTLISLGIVDTHQFKKGQATYELAGAKPHDHLIDIDSGRIIEFHSSALDNLKEEIADKYGYEIDNSHIAFYAHPIND